MSQGVRGFLGIQLLVVVVLMLPIILPVSAYPQSQGSVKNADSKFECTYSLTFIPGFDLDQFRDAKDAYGKSGSEFRAGLRNSILEAVKTASERTEGISIENLKIETLKVDDENGKVYVTITFDLVGFISTSNGKTTYDLTWRGFTASRKFSVGTGSEKYLIEPSEALALDFHDFSGDLRDWDHEVSSGETKLTRSEDYELETDLGKIDVETTYRIVISRAPLTLEYGTATYQETQEQTATGEENPRIPGFTSNSIIAGLILGVTSIICWRIRRKD